MALKDLRTGTNTALVLSFVLLAMVGLTSATDEGCAIMADWDMSNWKVLSIVALLISALIAAVMYMLGRMISKVELLEAAKMDLQQLMVSAVFLTIFGALMSMICSLKLSDFGLPYSGTFFSAAEQYFMYTRSLVVSKFAQGADAIMYISAISSVYTGFSFLPLGIPTVFSVSFAPFIGFQTMLQLIQLSMQLIQLSATAQVGYLVLLKMIEISFLSLLLPAGVVLRCFNPTRRLGGMLIAVAIGLFLFYPMMFALFYVLMGMPHEAVPYEPIWYDMLLLDMAEIYPSILEGGAGIIYLAAYAAMAIVRIFTSYPAVLDYLLGFGQIITYTILIPAISWIVIVAAVRDISRALGEEIDISSLARMI